jgi:hypothetical protein
MLLYMQVERDSDSGCPQRTAALGRIEMVVSLAAPALHDAKAHRGREGDVLRYREPADRRGCAA